MGSNAPMETAQHCGEGKVGGACVSVGCVVLVSVCVSGMSFMRNGYVFLNNTINVDP